MRLPAVLAAASALLAAPAPAATYGQQVVAAVLMGEAWSEGAAGMTAVAEVIRNRADKLNLSPLAVVQQPYQFSCLNHTTPRALIRKYERFPAFAAALEIARMTYNDADRLPNYAKGATHFERADHIPNWAEGHHPVAIVGGLAFYRLPDWQPRQPRAAPAVAALAGARLNLP